MNTNARQLHSAEVVAESVSEDVYVVPDGKTLRVDRFSGGLQQSQMGARVELVKRSGGGDEVLAIGYVGNFQYQIGEDLVGDGELALVMRLVNKDSGTLSMAAWWEGVLHD